MHNVRINTHQITRLWYSTPLNLDELYILILTLMDKQTTLNMLLTKGKITENDYISLTTKGMLNEDKTPSKKTMELFNEFIYVPPIIEPEPKVVELTNNKIAEIIYNTYPISRKWQNVITSVRVAPQFMIKRLEELFHTYPEMKECITTKSENDIKNAVKRYAGVNPITDRLIKTSANFIYDRDRKDSTLFNELMNKVDIKQTSQIEITNDGMID